MKNFLLFLRHGENDVVHGAIVTNYFEFTTNNNNVRIEDNFIYGQRHGSAYVYMNYKNMRRKDGKFCTMS